MSKPHPVLDGIKALYLKKYAEQSAQAVIVPRGEPVPRPPDRLTASPFTIDHRGELLKEMRADADELDRRAAGLTHTAISLRLAADHLEQNPPDP